MKKILFIVGSLREGSFNKILAKEAAKLLEGKASCEFLEYSDIPYMNQDIEFPTPESIKRVRELVSSADALWIFSPEYNYSYPGLLKNLLDWLSRPIDNNSLERKTCVKDKYVAITGLAGKSYAKYAIDNLKTLLTTIRMKVIDYENAGFTIPKEAFENGKYIPTDEDINKLNLEALNLLKNLE